MKTAPKVQVRQLMQQAEKSKNERHHTNATFLYRHVRAHFHRGETSKASGADSSISSASCTIADDVSALSVDSLFVDSSVPTERDRRTLLSTPKRQHLTSSRQSHPRASPWLTGSTAHAAQTHPEPKGPGLPMYTLSCRRPCAKRRMLCSLSKDACGR